MKYLSSLLLFLLTVTLIWGVHLVLAEGEMSCDTVPEFPDQYYYYLQEHYEYCPDYPWDYETHGCHYVLYPASCWPDCVTW